MARVLRLEGRSTAGFTAPRTPARRAEAATASRSAANSEASKWTWESNMRLAPSDGALPIRPSLSPDGRDWLARTMPEEVGGRLPGPRLRKTIAGPSGAPSALDEGRRHRCPAGEHC